jgi:hypothetical protein
MPDIFTRVQLVSHFYFGAFGFAFGTELLSALESSRTGTICERKKVFPTFRPVL